jgi:sigma-B regulation protein RsbU (phosphoserine phosphatase)
LQDDWFDAAPCGLLQTAQDGMLLRVNHTFCTWVGRTAEELVKRQRFDSLLTMGGRIFHQTHWAPLLRMQGSVSEVKLEIVHRDGTKLPMVLNAVRHDVDGKVRHDLAAFVARDRDRYERELISARRSLEEVVAETKQLHEEAKDRALFAEQMIGIVSHDLRNPLNTISMGAGLLVDMVPDAQRRIVERIQNATDRAATLIAELLDFTAARVGKGISVVPRPFDLHASVAESLEELRLAYPKCTLVHEPDGDGAAAADENRVTQVLGNLVSNAVAYGDPARPITITTRGGPCPELRVHNTGAPIPGDLQPRLFEPMTRGTEPGSSDVRSVGLGLYIVREIARVHGGTARVESSPESGTTFIVTFAQS